MLKVEKNRKIIVIDYSVFIHRAIHAWAKTKQIPSDYICFNSIIAQLKKIGVHPDDTILLALDSHGKGNWRSDLEPLYKSTRKEKRDKSGINFKDHFTKMDELLKNIKYSTPFLQLVIDKCEADDIMSWCARNFPKNEVILVTIDSDVEQLMHFDNVKIYSPMIKIKGAKGGYKIVKNPLKGLEKKIDKELADDLPKLAPNHTEKEYDIRKKIVTLITLPKEVDVAIENEIELLEELKLNFNLDSLKFKGIKDKFMQIYNSTNIVTYEDSLVAQEKKKRKKNGKRIRKTTGKGTGENRKTKKDDK